MDLMRLALERGGSARECVDVVTQLLARHPQGGRMGFRDLGFRYHSSFLFADRAEGWVLETAGEFWAAEKVRGVRTISNELSIKAPDLVHPGAADEARRRGWLKQGADFEFAGCFDSRLYRPVTGAAQRRACTTAGLGDAATADVHQVKAVLRDHRGRHPADGLVLGAPCAHASWQPTRNSNTTGSMVARLDARGVRLWLTGTSSPCLSVFKPVRLDLGGEELGPAAPERADEQSLFWRHERLHREVLRSFEERRAAFEGERAALEAKVEDAATPEAIRQAWEEHREAVPRWLEKARAVGLRSGGWAFDAWWRKQSRLDALA
jgi:dipeptidase